jgi:hypothetical protein
VNPTALEASRLAFAHARRFLFHPFRLGQWLRLAFVGVLAGEMGGGSCNYSYRVPADLVRPRAQHLQSPDLFGGQPLLMIAAVAAAVVLAIMLAVAFLYVSSRMRFVLFDSIVASECRVRHYWRQRGEPAFRYFVWQLLFGVGVVLALMILFAPPLIFAIAAGWFESPGAHLVPLILGGIVAALILFLLVITLAVIHVLTKDFVVPQMALEGVTVGEGWKRLWAQIVAEKAGYAAYVGMKIILTIATSIGVAIIGIVVALIVLIPVGAIGAIGVLGGAAAGLTWNPVTIAMAIALGAITFLVLIFLFAVISVPLIVFFPAYSCHFLAGRYPPMKEALG